MWKKFWTGWPGMLPPDKGIMKSIQDFLLVKHGAAGFLINREQFHASLYLQDLKPLEPAVDQEAHQYCFGTIDFRDEQVLVYDLNRRLGELFHLEEDEGLSIALVADVSSFSDRARQRFQEMVTIKAPEANLTTVAYRIGSQAEIKSLPLSQVKLVPKGLKELLRRKGVYGCRFTEDSEIYYFVDIEILSFGLLE